MIMTGMKKYLKQKTHEIPLAKQNRGDEGEEKEEEEEEERKKKAEKELREEEEIGKISSMKDIDWPLVYARFHPGPNLSSPPALSYC